MKLKLLIKQKKNYNWSNAKKKITSEILKVLSDNNTTVSEALNLLDSVEKAIKQIRINYLHNQ